MTQNYQRPLLPDYKRIELLEKSVADFRLFFETGSGAKKAAQMLKHQFRSYYFVLPPAWRIALRSLNWQKRVAPDLISTGAIRSGTSTMSNYILQHPCIVLPLSKEMGTLVPKRSFAIAQFPTMKEMEKVRSKYGVAKTINCTPISPSISWPYWGKAVNPNQKIVVVLRNPVDRTISHWRWNKMLTRMFDQDPLWEHMPGFSESMRIEMEDFYKGGCGFHLFSGAGGTSFLRHSVYTPFLKVVHNVFGKENVMTVNANDFFVDPVPHVKRVYEFLGLPDYEPVEIKETNPSPPADIDDSIKEELAEFFAPLNQELYELIGEDYNWQ